MVRLFAALALLFLPHTASAASFDCRKASAKIEKLICKDAELSRLDEEMAGAYAAALKSNGAVAGYIRLTQRHWVRGDRVLERPDRDRGGIYCHDDAGAAACLRGLYRDRIAVLRGGALPLSGLFERGGSMLKLQATADGMVIDWALEGGTGGGTETAVAVPPGAGSVTFALPEEGRPACRLEIAVAADAATIRQSGPCWDGSLAGRWTRDLKRDPADEMF